jgi:hypothetical protein
MGTLHKTGGHVCYATRTLIAGKALSHVLAPGSGAPMEASEKILQYHEYPRKLAAANGAVAASQLFFLAKGSS